MTTTENYPGNPNDPHYGEPAQEKYARHTRNAVVFIAVVIALGLLVTLVLGVVGAAELHTVGTWLNAVNQTQTGS